MIQRRSQSCVNLLTQLSNVSNSRKDVHRMSILTSTSSTINLASPLTQLLRNRNRLDISQSIRNYTANATDTVRSGNTPPTAKSESQAAQSVQGTTPDNLEQQNRSKVTSDVEAKDREIIELKDKYLRSVADYRNLQERTKREVKAARDFALQRFATDLLESLDNIDRALGLVDISAVPGSSPSSSPSPPAVERLHKDLQNLHSGLQMTQQVLLQTLRRHGLEPFDPAEAAESFDPNKHEAMFQAPQDGKKDGSVFHTQQKGYVLNGRILRAAKVGVVKNP